MEIKESKFTEDKSFGKLVVLSFRLSASWPTRISLVLVLSILLFNSYYFSIDHSELLGIVRAWSDLGLSYSISTMGFLIAGYTIFATLSNPRMMVAMMGHEHESTKLPTLKYNHLAFIRVFIHFLGVSFIFLCVGIFGHTNGILDNLLKPIAMGNSISIHVVKISYGIVGTCLFYMLLLLRVFIFNVYTVVMNTLRWEFREIKIEENDS